MASVGLGEIAVLCDECRLVPEGQFGLVGYADPYVRYDLLRNMVHLVICRRIFAWYRWIMARLDDAVQPHSDTGYVRERRDTCSVGGES